MNYLDKWFTLKLISVVSEAVIVAIMLAVAVWLYGLVGGTVFVKAPLIIGVSYYFMMFCYITVSLSSLVVDCKPIEQRTDNDKQTQFMVDKVGMVKTLVACLVLVFMLVALTVSL